VSSAGAELSRLRHFLIHARERPSASAKSCTFQSGRVASKVRKRSRSATNRTSISPLPPTVPQPVGRVYNSECDLARCACVGGDDEGASYRLLR
jgi:hypothetical protein